MALPLLSSPLLSAAGFRHGFSTRIGGVSPAPYDSLDFAVLREKSALRENQARLGAAVGFAPDRFFQATQVHGRAFVTAGGVPDDRLKEEADALVAEPGTENAVAIRVADCVPVLVGDRATGRVAAIHAGWRGVEVNIVEAVLAHLRQAGGVDASASISPGAGAGDRREGSRFVAAIGPCIGRCCFEVSAEIAERIAGVSTAAVIAERYAAPDGTPKARLDLRGAVRVQLVASGVEDTAIDDVPGRGRESCTVCDRERFYSYRRDGDASGRLLGVIVAA